MGKYRSAGLNTANDANAVTPSDSTAIEFGALYVGGSGNVVVKTDANGPAILFTAVPAGTVLPISGVRVMAATTATSIVALR